MIQHYYVKMSVLKNVWANALRRAAVHVSRQNIEIVYIRGEEGNGRRRVVGHDVWTASVGTGRCVVYVEFNVGKIKK
jgi:hypothetical protein